MKSIQELADEAIALRKFVNAGYEIKKCAACNSKGRIDRSKEDIDFQTSLEFFCGPIYFDDECKNCHGAGWIAVPPPELIPQ